MKRTSLLCLGLLLTAALAGCTENQRAKKFGGTMTVNLECGVKLVSITWKDESLWKHTRPMEPGEKPVTHTFEEDSNFGLVTGRVVVNECAAGTS